MDYCGDDLTVNDEDREKIMAAVADFLDKADDDNITCQIVQDTLVAGVEDGWVTYSAGDVHLSLSITVTKENRGLE